MDTLKLYRQRGASPFPLCLATLTVTRVDSKLIGECFLLVENGKEFFNGRRISLPEGTCLATCIDQLTQQASSIVSKMYSSSQRQNTQAESLPEPALQWDEVPVNGLTQLWADGRFRSHIKWVSQKAASPQLREIASNISKTP